MTHSNLDYLPLPNDNTTAPQSASGKWRPFAELRIDSVNGNKALKVKSRKSTPGVSNDPKSTGIKSCAHREMQIPLRNPSLEWSL